MHHHEIPSNLSDSRSHSASEAGRISIFHLPSSPAPTRQGMTRSSKYIIKAEIPQTRPPRISPPPYLPPMLRVFFFHFLFSRYSSIPPPPPRSSSEGQSQRASHGLVHLHLYHRLGGGGAADLGGGHPGLGGLVVRGHGGGVEVVDLHGLGADDVLQSGYFIPI